MRGSAWASLSFCGIFFENFLLIEMGSPAWVPLFFCGIFAVDFLLIEMRGPAWASFFFCGICAADFLLRETSGALSHFTKKELQENVKHFLTTLFLILPNRRES